MAAAGSVRPLSKTAAGGKFKAKELKAGKKLKKIQQRELKETQQRLDNPDWAGKSLGLDFGVGDARLHQDARTVAKHQKWNAKQKQALVSIAEKERKKIEKRRQKELARLAKSAPKTVHNHLAASTTGAFRLGVWEAARCGNLDFLERMANEGRHEQFRAVHPDSQATPIHEAAAGGRTDAIKFLMNFNHDIEARDAQGRTPLHCAVDAGWEDSAVFLVLSGADIHARDTAGNSCYDRAEKHSSAFADRIKKARGDWLIFQKQETDRLRALAEQNPAVSVMSRPAAGTVTASEYLCHSSGAAKEIVRIKTEAPTVPDTVATDTDASFGPGAELASFGPGAELASFGPGAAIAQSVSFGPGVSTNAAPFFTQAALGYPPSTYSVQSAALAGLPPLPPITALGIPPPAAAFGLPPLPPITALGLPPALGSPMFLPTSPAISSPTSPAISSPTSPAISSPTSPAISSPAISSPTSPAISSPAMSTNSQGMSDAISAVLHEMSSAVAALVLLSALAELDQRPLSGEQVRAQLQSVGRQAKLLVEEREGGCALLRRADVTGLLDGLLPPLRAVLQWAAAAGTDALSGDQVAALRRLVAPLLQSFVRLRASCERGAVGAAAGAVDALAQQLGAVVAWLKRGEAAGDVVDQLLAGSLELALAAQAAWLASAAGAGQLAGAVALLLRHVQLLGEAAAAGDQAGAAACVRDVLADLKTVKASLATQQSADALALLTSAVDEQCSDEDGVRAVRGALASPRAAAAADLLADLAAAAPGGGAPATDRLLRLTAVSAGLGKCEQQTACLRAAVRCARSACDQLLLLTAAEQLGGWAAAVGVRLALSLLFRQLGVVAALLFG